jgi:type III secretion protein L
MVFVVHKPGSLARPDPATKVVRADDVRAYRSAEDIIADARREAAAIVQSAQAAYEDERRRGYEDGREEAKLESAERMIENVSRTVEYFARIEDQMVELVMAAVRKIIADFDDRARVLMVVRSALSAVRTQKQMTLRVAPVQLEQVRAGMNEILAAFPGIGYLDIVGDPRLADDACILESDIGVVEASVSGQLEALRGAFRKVLGGRS